MPNSYFRFKQFTIHQDRCAMKVTTDACVFGAWAARLLAVRQEQRILDIGAGTGLLPLMIAQQNETPIDAVELDAEAACQAAGNAAISPWRERIRIIPADIRTYTPAAKYDAVISNPPFYENELAGSQTARNRAHHSSDLTLKQVVENIDRHLSAAGDFFLLLPHKRRHEAAQLLSDQGFWITRISTVRHSPAHRPFRVLVTGSRAKRECIEELFDIRDETGDYTKEFISLLKEYYLYL